MERRLTTIVAADIAGYSRLMAVDEEDVIRRLGEMRSTVIDPVIEMGHGRLFKTMGDGLLFEFASPVEAVRSALAIQEAVSAHQADLSDETQLRFRIGINLGDVVIDGEDVLGDCVNIAARLETMAPVGGICLSHAVYEQVKGRIDTPMMSLGPQNLKNIPEPINVWQISSELITHPSGAAPARTNVFSSSMAKRSNFAFSIVLILALSVSAGLMYWNKPPDVVSPVNKSDKPAIAVLPFLNLSDDREQEYFVDGMTDDLITDLSKVSGLMVISRNSVFTYKNNQKPVEEVARELGVRYVLEGSVRRDSERIRVNTQLVDGTTKATLWADRYESENSDLFALQDKMISSIVASLSVTLTEKEQARVVRIPTTSMEAYDYYLRARRGFWGWTSEGRRTAFQLYQRAVNLDPQFADAYSGIAKVAAYVWKKRESEVLPASLARKLAYQAASKALALDQENGLAFAVLSILQVADGLHEEAMNSISRAITLRPGSAEVHADLAQVLVYTGKSSNALDAMETAFRLEPNPLPDLYADLGWVLFFNRQYEEAIVALEKARKSGVEPYETLAKTYAQLERQEEADATVEKLLDVFPGASIVNYRSDEIRHFKRKKDLDHSLDSLRKAGVPEWPFGYQANTEDRLDAAAIKKLTFGQTWIGNDTVNGGPFIQENGADGKIAFRSGYSLITGTAREDDDRLCMHFPARGDPDEYCAYLFRNPQGTPEKQNEYVLLGNTQILQFSLKAP